MLRSVSADGSGLLTCLYAKKASLLEPNPDRRSAVKDHGQEIEGFDPHPHAGVLQYTSCNCTQEVPS